MCWRIGSRRLCAGAWSEYKFGSNAIACLNNTTFDTQREFWKVRPAKMPKYLGSDGLLRGRGVSFAVTRRQENIPDNLTRYMNSTHTHTREGPSGPGRDVASSVTQETHPLAVSPPRHTPGSLSSPWLRRRGRMPRVQPAAPAAPVRSSRSRSAGPATVHEYQCRVPRLVW